MSQTQGSSTVNRLPGKISTSQRFEWWYNIVWFRQKHGKVLLWWLNDKIDRHHCHQGDCSLNLETCFCTQSSRHQPVRIPQPHCKQGERVLVQHANGDSNKSCIYSWVQCKCARKIGQMAIFFPLLCQPSYTRTWTVQHVVELPVFTSSSATQALDSSQLIYHQLHAFWIYNAKTS